MRGQGCIVSGFFIFLARKGKQSINVLYGAAKKALPKTLQFHSQLSCGPWPSALAEHINVLCLDTRGDFMLVAAMFLA